MFVLCCIGICWSICMSAGDALYRVKVIWVDSSGRAPCSGCPHSGLECHGNGPALHGHSPCQPGQSLTLLGYHPGKVHWQKGKAPWPWQLYSSAFWTVIQCKEAIWSVIVNRVRSRLSRNSTLKKQNRDLKCIKLKIWLWTCVFLINKSKQTMQFQIFFSP